MDRKQNGAVRALLAMVIALSLALLAACAAPAEPGGGAPSGQERPTTGGGDGAGGAVEPSGAQGPGQAKAGRSEPRPGQPVLVLDLPVGPGPDQPGRMPGRVGGVSPRGPVSFAVAEDGAVYLLDEAGLRLLRYEGGRLAHVIPLPWLEEYGGSLYLDRRRAGWIYLGIYDEYAVDETGRIVDPPRRREKPVDPDALWRLSALDPGKESALLGRDLSGRRYELRFAGDRYEVRRVGPDGAVEALARAPKWGGEGRALHPEGWYITAGGGVYVMASVWAEGKVERTQVYQVMAPVTLHRPDPAPPPVPRLPGELSPPERVEIRAADGPPVVVEDPVALHSLWALFSAMTGKPMPERDAPGSAPAEGQMIWLTAVWPDGRTEEMALSRNPFGRLVWRGRLYGGEGAGGMALALVDALRYGPDSLAGAVREASAVRVTIPDLPGVARELTAAEREELAGMLAGATPVHYFSTPQPLEEPFPRYGLEVKGEGWTVTAFLRGERHLAFRWGSPALECPGALSRRMQAWLPVPEAGPEEVADLYRAEELTIRMGEAESDLTRWKAMVVRYLLGVTAVAEPSREVDLGVDRYQFHFQVDGEERVVAVDREGFTYAGRRYERPGLLSLVQLQGVP